MAKPVHPRTKDFNDAALTARSQASAIGDDFVDARGGNPRQVGSKALPKYVTDATLASMIDSSRSTVWRYVQQGILPQPIKIGGLTRFDLEHAMRCIRAGKVVPAPIAET